MLFFGEDKKTYFEIHSLVVLDRLAAVMPFIIKAYIYSLPPEDKARLFSSLECLVLRHRLIGTTANIASRLNYVYENLTNENKSVDDIIGRIEWMKSEQNYWWGHWNNDHLQEAIGGYVEAITAKYILWKYENYLASQGHSGYKPRRFDSIISPELEHIAPKTPTDGEPVSAGYCEYDEDFVNEYIECLGNYLLLSKSQNCSIGNRPFAEKRASYTHSFQQREIQEMTKEKEVWNKEKINKRHRKIVDFVIKNL